MVDLLNGLGYVDGKLRRTSQDLTDASSMCQCRTCCKKPKECTYKPAFWHILNAKGQTATEKSSSRQRLSEEVTSGNFDFYIVRHHLLPRNKTK